MQRFRIWRYSSFALASSASGSQMMKLAPLLLKTSPVSSVMLTRSLDRFRIIMSAVSPL